ncbi:hypothetical protein BDQ12DRAFT_738888 [Crucibulum laeve]|uniref:Uncharacterized protein n=1 Tax=Crucibulum laeve TaxID=68775 RepID=A0A5C3LJI9_9AGAR|nr:hypothetical protein BDQ12DRAFT_738888 [Crucibulum laeve]
MPLIYNYREPSPESEDENSSLHPTDADESIVLSDLVRTGEASRLRRRGAMRLDHGHIIPSALSGASAALSVVVVDSPSWDSEQEDAPGPSGRVFQSPRNQRSQVDEYSYTLVCGGYDSEEEGETEEHGAEPYRPSVLPLYPPPRSKGLVPRRTRRTNGCGALIHMSAAPRQRQCMWTGKAEATSAVVPLDRSYFRPSDASLIVSSSCGCVREGVGCAVCGNPLGTRFTPCTISSSTSDCSSAKHLPLRGPEGPQYWHPTPRRPSSSPKYTYAFFSTAVSSNPPYTFPYSPRSISPVSTIPDTPPIPNFTMDFEAAIYSSSTANNYTTSTNNQRNADSNSDSDSDSEASTPVYNANTNPLFDRFITASPTPLSDVGEEEGEREYGNGNGGDIPSGAFYQLPQREMQVWGGEWDSGFDPDGDRLVAPPESPDKTEGMGFMFVER